MISLGSERLYFDGLFSFLLFLNFFDLIGIVSEESETSPLLDNAMYLISVADALSRAETLNRILPGVGGHGPHDYSASIVIFVGEGL
jgi:hypothetical protein